ncbi:MAG: succinyl-diaminopimelate desuccinylase [Rhodothermales bacterium]|jgi:succinyl-diaminopimelate desuccinylase
MIETEPKNLREQLIQLTRDLVMVPSSAERPDDVERALEIVRHHVDNQPGVDVQVYRSAGNPSIAAMPASSPLHCDILLCAHVDVVSHGSASIYRPEVRGDRIVGPGAGDMKGQLAILIGLFRAAHERAPGLSLGLVVTTDEEIGGMHGIRHLLDDVGIRCNTAIIPDGGSINRFPIAEKGILHLRLTLPGLAAHAARPWLARNALQRAANVIHRLEQAFPLPATSESAEHWYPTCSPTVLRTDNASINRIPPAAELLLDCRFPPPLTSEDICERIRALLTPEDQLEVIISANPSALNPDPEFLRIASKITGHPAQQIRESGGSDGRFFAAHGIPVIISRPEVGNLHDIDEWIDIPTMLVYHKMVAEYINQRLGL